MKNALQQSEHDLITVYIYFYIQLKLQYVNLNYSM